METIDLLQTSEKDVRWLIKKTCNGKFSILQRLRRRGTGFGGIYYQGGWKEIDRRQKLEDPLRANMEVFHRGYGIYLKNSQEHYLILLTFEDLESIRLQQGHDQFFLLTLQLKNGEKASFKFIKASEHRIVKGVTRVFGRLDQDDQGYY